MAYRRGLWVVLLAVVSLGSCMVVLAAPRLGPIVSPAALLRGEISYTPIRDFCNWLDAETDAELEVDGDRYTVTDGKTVVKMTLGSSRARVNGEETHMEAAPFVYLGAAYAPSGFLAQAFGLDLSLDRAARHVVFRRPVKAATPGPRPKAGRPAATLSLETWPMPADALRPGPGVQLGLRVLRRFMVTQHPKLYPQGDVVLLDVEANPWLQSGPYLEIWDDVIDHKNSLIERDPRFVDAIRRAGGKVGDDWDFYRAERLSASEMRVTVLRWNWGFWVDVSAGDCRLTGRFVEATGEGNEDQPPLRWKITGPRAKWRFVRVK